MKKNIKHIGLAGIVPLLIITLVAVFIACASSETLTTTNPPILNSIMVTSGPSNPSSLAVQPQGTYQINVGIPRQFYATGMYSDGHISDITSQVEWESSNTDRATISVNGLVNPSKAGITAIRASQEISPGVTVLSRPVTLMINASDIRLTSISITPGQPDDILAGTTLQFTATGTFSDGSSSDITSLVTWTSSNSTVAAISSTALTPYSGLATGFSAGTTDISASMHGVTATTALSVSYSSK